MEIKEESREHAAHSQIVERNEEEEFALNQKRIDEIQESKEHQIDNESGNANEVYTSQTDITDVAA